MRVCIMSPLVKNASDNFCHNGYQSSCHLLSHNPHSPTAAPHHGNPLAQKPFIKFPCTYVSMLYKTCNKMPPQQCTFRPWRKTGHTRSGWPLTKTSLEHSHFRRGATLQQPSYTSPSRGLRFIHLWKRTRCPSCAEPRSSASSDNHLAAFGMTGVWCDHNLRPSSTKSLHHPRTHTDTSGHADTDHAEHTGS